MFDELNLENSSGDHKTISLAKLREEANATGKSLFETELKFLRNEIVPLKYIKTVQAIGLANMIQLRLSKVAVLGCGGVGGFVCEILVRMGVGTLITVDGDVFEETNLNRQLCSYEDNLGISKSKITCQTLRRINSASLISYVDQKLTVDNFSESIGDPSVVVDALDRLDDRLAFSRICRKRGIPYFFGNIGSSDFRIGVQSAGSDLLERIFEGSNVTDPAEGSPAVTAGLCGVALAGEVIKYLLGMENVLIDKLMQVNWHQNQVVIIDMAIA